MQVQVVIANESERMQKLYTEWSLLAQQCGHSFASFPFWYEAKVNITKNTNNIIFVLIYEKNRLKAVLPFEKKTFKFSVIRIHYLQLFYSNEMGLCDITSNVSLPPLWEDIRKTLSDKKIHCHFIKCQHYLSGSNIAHSNLTDHASFTKVSHQSSALIFDQGYDAFINRYNTKFRRNIRRLTKKAKSIGELTIECVRQVDQLETAFKHFLQVEDCGWKGEKGTSIQKQPKMLAYYQTLLDGFTKTGNCQINLLMLDGKCIAAQFCVFIEKTLYLLKIGYDERYASISPGQILIDRLVEYGSDTQHFNEISFVTGYGWMDRWRPTLKPVFLSYLPCGNIWGQLFIVLLKIRTQLQGWRQKRMNGYATVNQEAF